MDQSLCHIALLVDDYDEAIAFYTQKLDFELIEDTQQADQDKRWVLVRPKGEGRTSILLAKAKTAEQKQFIGNQSGGRVFLFLQTDDFERDYTTYKKRGIQFIRPPQNTTYGTVAVFSDLYGNLWDLIEHIKYGAL